MPSITASGVTAPNLSAPSVSVRNVVAPSVAASASVASFCPVSVEEVVLTRKALHKHTAAGARSAMITQSLSRLCQPQGIINIFGMGIFMISSVGVVAATGFDANLPLAGQAIAAAVGMAIGIRATLSA